MLTMTEHPAPPRSPLLDEMHAAAQEALAASDPNRRAYWTGCFTGYAVGFGILTREPLDRARNDGLSYCVDLSDRPHKNPFADSDTYWSCGVRYGYWLATSERYDADSCELCGERLIDGLDVNVDVCACGVFCGWDDHQRTWHASEADPMGCLSERFI